LQKTLRETAFKGASDSEFVALVIVANTYDLNPLLREIYAFPKKGGGIQAIVGYDGWIKIANSHPMFDGIEFVHIEDEKGDIKAVEGVLYRKDRNHPTKKMIYLKEFKRNTEPWNNAPRHMLDVRCFCHTVRVGLGVSLGIEGDENLVDGGEIRTARPVSLPRTAELPDDDQGEVVDQETGEVLSRDPATGMTEVDEETARALDAGQSDEAEPEPEQSEKGQAVDTSSGPAADEPDADQEQNVDTDKPVWWEKVQEIRAGINAAKTTSYLAAHDKNFVNLRAGLPPELVEELDAQFAAKRRELSARAQSEG
jgi:hypothetical protein